MLYSAGFWAAAGFLIGSLPFSYWLGRVLLHTDVRLHGDGNPGAANAWRAGTWRVGIPAVLLDYLKGAVPVFLAWYWFGISGWALVPVTLAPVLGHAISPFLGLRGGKAVAVTFGVWTGLTIWEGPTVLGLAVGLISRLQAVDAWTVVLGMTCLLVYLLLRGTNAPTVTIWAGNLAILIWKHQGDLRQMPRLTVRLPWERHR